MTASQSRATPLAARASARCSGTGASTDNLLAPHLAASASTTERASIAWGRFLTFNLMDALPLAALRIGEGAVFGRRADQRGARRERDSRALVFEGPAAARTKLLRPTLSAGVPRTKSEKEPTRSKIWRTGNCRRRVARDLPAGGDQTLIARIITKGRLLPAREDREQERDSRTNHQ